MENSIPVITVSRDTSGELLLRDLAKSVRTVQLETHENAPLSNADDVKLFPTKSVSSLTCRGVVSEDTDNGIK